MSYETVDTTTPPATADGSVGVTEPEIVVLQDVLPADAELRDAELQVSITFMHPSTTILIAASAMPPGAGESMVTAMPDLAMSMADSRNQVSTSQVLGQGASDYSRRLSNLLGMRHHSPPQVCHWRVASPSVGSVLQCARAPRPHSSEDIRAYR